MYKASSVASNALTATTHNAVAVCNKADPPVAAACKADPAVVACRAGQAAEACKAAPQVVVPGQAGEACRAPPVAGDEFEHG
jgi:hypothetical protein